MLKVNWRTALATGLALLAAFGVAGYILGFELGEQAGEENAHTQEYARHAAEEIENTCRGLDAAAEAVCIVRVIEATNEDQRAQSDLNAQRDMARWALYMLLATVVMALVTALGVYFVWQTLLETRRIGVAQVRAYVHCVEAKISGKTDGADVILVDVALQNTGQSPARNVGMTGIATVHAKQQVITSEMQWPQRLSAGGKGHDSVVFISMDGEIAKAMRISFEITIGWIDVFDNFISARFAFSGIQGETITDIVMIEPAEQNDRDPF